MPMFRRRSTLTGQVNTREIPVDPARVAEWDALGGEAPKVQAASYVQRIRIERGRWLWISWGADSCGKPAACVPPPPGLAAAERGQAPQDGSDRNRLGSSDPWESVVGPPSLQPPGS